MRIEILFLLILSGILLCSCNIPSVEKKVNTESSRKLLWDLNISEKPTLEISRISEKTAVPSTPTPQLYRDIDFESAFSGASPLSGNYEDALQGGNDSAQWAYFSPPEYSTDAIDTLYAAFDNTGNSIWKEDYRLEFYAGSDPAGSSDIRLDTSVQPGERGVFQIPITSKNASWKACWKMKNSDGNSFNEFCYNHGSGQNAEDVAAGVPGKEGYFAFQKTDGTAPEKYSSGDQSAELIATSPKTGHTFKAYDHFETISVTFRNNGSSSWNSAYTLVFYSGYNWFHETRFSVPGNVGPGETVTITMPMEIIEDNDKWYTCWYLSTPDGKNLYDFCFNYYTKS